ncbi:hypothetical protein N7499_003988 [Penicillium canescens]|uniref:Uncharacterized protein n=1 Tax=Penicillium canescens TaxID=5083 RepID=A0AAD6ILJ8_PENCN|nr:uncharacterized protein N7446_007499 [Penicillium canescens]KAJ6049174.1 hypothetical protein N7444_005890 [Penicillium canescens]KAJ6052854.1 hypothetical protein N7460_003388 [Penicillium canescens]KAJ6063379.1 hypothetical protein N7446_007499 [Penicillium canescens]KAJ6089141.1 hypothetical protein N7499_003988 [Penicillium canescens]KAJ6181577.1 hypothetical protein N7485_000219 [Penicillium canescens]
MRGLVVALLAVQCAQVLGHPHAAANTEWIPAKTTTTLNPTPMPEAGETARLHEKREYGEILLARATTETTDSSTSTTESTTSTTSTSDTTTTTTSESTSTSTSSSTTTSSTTTSSITSSTSSTTSSTWTSSSSTTSTSTTTTSTATATSTTSAAVKAWNHRGNITAIVFGCCLISLFLGISIVHCARDRAKARRIAARELLESNASYSAIPPAASKGISTPEVNSVRSSMMFTNKPQTSYFPSTRSVPSVSNYHSHTPSVASQLTADRMSTGEQTSRPQTSDANTPLV